MNLNYEVIDEMVDRLAQIELDLQSLKHLQKMFPKKWYLMLSINAKIKSLNLEKLWIKGMLEDEYEQIEIAEVLFYLQEGR